MSELYKRIESLCKAHGVNITEMCRESGAPRGSLTDLKAGRTNGLSTATLTKVAAYFGVSIEYLLAGEETQDKKAEKATVDVIDDDLREYLDELRSRPEQRLLFSVTKNASKAQIEAIVKMIKEMQGYQ